MPERKGDLGVTAWPDRREAGWFVAILALAAVLRVIRLGTYPFWHDEVHNLIKAEHIGDVVFRGEYVSNHPPLFSILAATWKLFLVGEPEWFMRTLPAFLGVLTVGVVYWVGRSLFGAGPGLFAAYLAAVSPALVTHSQDFKEYMILPVTGTLATGLLYLAANRNGAIWWAAYSVMAALACYSESFAGPLLIAVNSWYLIQIRGRERTLPRWAVANIVGFALFAPYLPFLLSRADSMLVQSSSWWIPKPTLLSVVFYLKTLAFGYSALEPYYEIALVLYMAFFGVGCLIAFKRAPRVASLLLIWFVVPVALVFALSRVIESIFLFRSMLPFAIPFYILIGVAWDRLRFPMARPLVAAVFAAFAIPGLWQHYERILHPLEFPHRPGIHAPQDFSTPTAHIVSGWRDGDGVVCTAINSWIMMRWYGLEDQPLYFGAVGSRFIEDLSAANVRTSSDPQYDTLLPREIETIVGDFDRIWYVYAEWERMYLPGNTTDVWRWLDARFPELDRFVFDGGEVRLYDTSRHSMPDRPLRRDADDGLAASFSWSDQEEPYRRYLPDWGLAPLPDADRRGRLRVGFSEEGAGDQEPAPLDVSKRRVRFSIENVSDGPVHCTVTALASDRLVEAAVLTEDDVHSDVWRVSGHHNPGDGPPDYQLHTAIAHFSEAGSAAIGGEIDLSEGTYDSLTYVLGVPGDTTRGRAGLQIEVNDTNVLSDALADGALPFQWNWRWGNPVTIGVEPALLRMTVTHPAGLQESFADVGYVAFVKRRGVGADSITSGEIVESWPGEVALDARSSQSWTMDVDRNAGRVDVWVFDHEDARGKAYRIFEVLDSAG